MENSFFTLLDKIIDNGSLQSPDFVAYALPLVEQILTLHENNKVAFLTQINELELIEGRLKANSNVRDFVIASKELFAKPKAKGALEISGTIQVNNDLDTYETEYTNLSIEQNLDEVLKEPKYLLGYNSWDYHLGHYDPLTEIFVIGQILASLAFGLDFRKKEDLELFVDNRKRLYFLNKNLHPTLLNVVFEMTHLFREDRSANLEEIVAKLKNYREYNPENYIDLTQTEGFRNQDVSKRESWILSKLKNRLFDISRRNKLLYFTDKQNFMNLTIASVPLLLDHNNIQEKDLIFWNSSLAQKVVKSKKIVLNNYIEFDKNRFLAPTINKIRLDAGKSLNEYGFSQLRTVIAFIHWYNFKESAEERITTPLLLLPTDVVKKKGVNDQYSLEFQTTEAEINPILSHYFKELYDIKLPDFIDLDTTSVDELVANIQTQIAASGTGITLEWRKTPKIQLVHSIAKKNFNLRSKTLDKRASGLNLRAFNYSYDKLDYQPLGLQIFNDRIRQKNNALEYIINEDLSPEVNHAVAEKVRNFYTNDNDGEVNPLVWEIDTCNITIGNFNYRKMSLVRDYNEIIDANIKDEIFEQLFSEVPKIVTPFVNGALNLKQNYPIIAADPTQTAAIQIARTGQSYIIQGPPGTGKSQTITNLIADYVARDKKILFVCEKRAALDVVFHRLKNKNLDELCCLIHDSQTDKKAFIQNLKITYEDWMANKLDDNAINEKRNKVIAAINDEMGKLSRFHSAMNGNNIDISPLVLFEVLHATGEHRKPENELASISFPKYTEWLQNRDWISDWKEQLKINGFSEKVAAYPFAELSSDIIQAANPKAIVLDKLHLCTQLLDEFGELLDELDLPNSDDKNLRHWNEKFALADKLIGLLQAGKIGVLTYGSPAADEFNAALKEIQNTETTITKLHEETKNWKHKLSPEDTQTALSQWVKYNQSILRFVNPGFYKLKKSIESAYSFSAHKIKPDTTVILEKLNHFHTSVSLLSTQKESLRQEFGLQYYDEETAWIKEMQSNPTLLIKEWSPSNKTEEIRKLQVFSRQWAILLKECSLVFGNVLAKSHKQLDTDLANCLAALGSLSVFIPFIEKTKSLTPEMQHVLFTKYWNMHDFDYQLAYKSLADIYEKDREFSDVDEDRLQSSIVRINAMLSVYYECNVDAIRSKIRAQFLDKIRISESIAAQLNADEKVAKKSYTSARRILENEFTKTMRYKSIRELTSSDAGAIMNALKPVWLMSPLSVSDTMPIDTSLFDVVIYDEASQITVEEGIPSLFRTNQTIIVGDEMQMPPTNFFSASNAVDEEEEEIEDKIGISLDADSLLNQGGRKLNSVMLGWHYRSRHESLISFSNAAFYKRSLLTIPDNLMGHSDNLQPLPAIVDYDVPLKVDTILSRNISYCYLENAVYENRKNRDEAKYIAKLVRELLFSKTKYSIGIVAFSMDQQSEIEFALDQLAASDSRFESLLENEYNRVDEDQFNGLFVKNLENVQGDERDIIIMSVCYGSNSKGKMLMNFGPINRRGGEKRLNVIFSRAKNRMVVVTSIQPNEIRNDYNEGANYFKRFLQYAKHISDGKLQEANTILNTLHLGDEHLTSSNTGIIVSQLQKALEAKGWQVETNIGQSHFKCDLAITKPGNNSYSLGILVDKPEHYNNENVLEQYCQKPQLLNAFGWKINRVLAKDWLERPERVLEKIENSLAGIEDKAAVDIEATIQSFETKPSNNAPSIDSLIKELNAQEKEPEDAEIKNEEPQKATTQLGEQVFERYEFSEGNSNKYWQVAVYQTTLEVQYGRIGNQPQISTKVFDTAAQAQNEKEKLAAKKVGKGYVRV